MDNNSSDPNSAAHHNARHGRSVKSFYVIVLGVVFCEACWIWEFPPQPPRALEDYLQKLQQQQQQQQFQVVVPSASKEDQELEFVQQLRQVQVPALAAQAGGSNTTKIEGDSSNIHSTGRIIFALESERFVEGFASCFEDETCHILYHHIQKTGGTFIASTFYPILNNSTYNDQKWCCNEKFMNRFRRDPDKFCKLRLGIYEVYGDDFKEVVKTCQKFHAKNNERAIALATIREPVQRTVSWIHQQCNKNYGRMGTFQPVCDRCSYSQDQERWDKFIDEQINVYLQLPYKVPGMDVYTIEDVMLNRFLRLLQTRLNLKYPKGHSNTEKNQICNFEVQTAVFRKFKEAHLVYRELITGMDMPRDS